MARKYEVKVHVPGGLFGFERGGGRQLMGRGTLIAAIGNQSIGQK